MDKIGWVGNNFEENKFVYKMSKAFNIVEKFVMRGCHYNMQNTCLSIYCLLRNNTEYTYQSGFFCSTRLNYLNSC